jgi:D-serine deaminase-like pyridoxal phosphate-dependent protein
MDADQTAIPSAEVADTGERLRLGAVLAEPIDGHFKAFPAPERPVPIGSAGLQGWNALEPPFLTPVMVLKDRALQHNIDLMASYCAARGLSLAPHTKTPLAPQIADRQLAAGAWALTIADVHQARVLRAAGAQRLLIANEVADAAAIEWIARELDADPGLEVYCLIDSWAGAALLDRHLAGAGFRGQLPVLIELGIPGARCGCRTVAEAIEVAARATKLPRLRIAGAEAYENLFPPGTAEQTAGQVDRLLDDVRDLLRALDSRGMFSAAGEILVSGGGSMWFDRVAARLTGSWALSRPVRTVIRAGAYITHDAAEYEQFSPLAGRSAGPPRLEQALELWATVLSRPEPELAILNFGKRDAGYDQGYPIPFAARTASGPLALDSGRYEILSLNDQHARLRLPADAPLAVGDLVASHICHPCTSFDKWRLLPLVTGTYDVTGAIRSYL